jgi:hypothetical protein
VGVGSGELGAKSAFLGFAQVKHLFKTAGSGERGVGNRLNEALIMRSISTGVSIVRQAVCQLIDDWQMLEEIRGDLTDDRNKLQLDC